MKRKITFILPAIFVAVVGILIVWFTLSKPRVLILQSYNPDYSWVRDVNTGLDRVLGKKSHWNIRHYNMDTKRHPWVEYKTKIGITARRMIDNWKPDLIIAIDDDAQQFVGKYYVNHPTIKLVFAGVNLEPSKYGYDTAQNVTGLLERLPLPDLREALLDFARINGKTKPIRLMFIDDKSETVQGDEKNILAFDWNPVALVGTKLVGDFEEFKMELQNAQDKADIIMMDGYRRISRSKTDKTLVPPSEIQRWVATHSKLPTIGVNGFFAEDGGMLAIGTSPFEQGEIPAKMAVDIIENNKNPKDIPIMKSTQFIVAMRASLMKEKNFSVPRVYEAAARSVDKYYP